MTTEREPAPNAPGSIEQHLDMCESGPLKGEEFAHYRTRARNLSEGAIVDTDRETDEMSGDDHSRGLQGGEPELETEPHPRGGAPGDETRNQDQTTDDLERNRAG